MNSPKPASLSLVRSKPRPERSAFSSPPDAICLRAAPNGSGTFPRIIPWEITSPFSQQLQMPNRRL